MSTPRRGLSDDDLAAVRGREQRVVAGDGGRLELEWAERRARSGRDLLAAAAATVELELAVDDPGALGLRPSLGFVPVTAEDDGALPLPAS